MSDQEADQQPSAPPKAPAPEAAAASKKAAPAAADKSAQADEEAFAKFKECAIEVLHVKPEKVTLEANFADDLDADSLDLVELVMALEEQFGITVDESELEGVSTVGQAFELVSSKL